VAVAPRLHGALRPAELAEAAVLGDIALVFMVLGWFLPLGGALQVLATVPIALLANRHRPRAAVVATIAISAAGFVIGGLGLVVQAFLYGSLGIAVGIAHRRGGGALMSLWLGTLYTGLPAALGSLALSALFPSLRKLLLAQVNIYGKGLARICNQLGLEQLAKNIITVLTWVNTHWWISYPLFELIAIGIIAGLAGRYMKPLLGRLERDGVPVHTGPEVGDPGDTPEPGAAVSGATSSAAAASAAAAAAVEVAPLPVSLRNASYRYPGTADDAAHDVSFEITPGSLTLLVGPNGSGKSTVARLLAGLHPTSGEVVRPGDAGLGRHGGTAMIFQRPESQVLGVRVKDDVVFGLPADVACDVEELLGHVGLSDMGDRETSTLSGGELQRLAIAAALAREPQLIVSDESTSMLDTEGQASVETLLGRLAGEGVAVVHATHRRSGRMTPTQVVTLSPHHPSPSPSNAADGPATDAPASGAPASGAPASGAPASGAPTAGARDTDRPDATVGTKHGRFRHGFPPTTGRARAGDVEKEAPAPATTTGPTTAVGTGTETESGSGSRAEAPPPASVRLRGVGHVYAAGTPWAHRALEAVDLDVDPGEGVIITGANGSGKSTLAWVISGLVAPSEGDAEVGGRKAVESFGHIGIAFQHARLQLIRPTVLADVALGSDRARARSALELVGLDPERVGRRRVDALSGGEQRRVALAGILARDPVLVVLDEPLAGLDEGTRDTLEHVLLHLRKTAGVATLLIAHDLEAAAGMGDRLITLDQGRVVGDGPMSGKSR
jgi:energy-coupling factor transport system ATP-binding protein